MTFYTGKQVLVTGGTGLIGRPLVEMLQTAGAKVRIAALDDPSRAPDGVEFRRVDLREFGQCMEVAEGCEIVFQLAGVKGSPAIDWTPFSYLFNYTGQPAASVPCGWTKDGLPIGLQIIGRRFDDIGVLKVAAAFEKAAPWGDKRPDLD